MIDEQGNNVDAETKNYLDTFQTNINNQFAAIKELFQSKLDPTVETTKEHTKEIKDHSQDISELKVEITQLKGNVRILEDNKKSKKDKEALTPKTIANYIALAGIIVGFIYFLVTK